MTEIIQSVAPRFEQNFNKSYDSLILTIMGVIFIAVVVAICVLTNSSGVNTSDLSTMTVFP
jgi:hypothetical protein